MTLPITIAYESLTKDAAVWDGVGDKLTEVEKTVSGMGLARGMFSFAGEPAADSYARIHATVVKLLADGATQTHGAATALREIRADFESTERSIQDDIAKLWQPTD